MDNQKFELILDGLLRQSEEGRLEWKPTATPTLFLLALKGSSISMQKFSRIFEFDFRNERGFPIEHVRIDEASDINLREKTNKLYNLVEVKVLNVDDTINKIIEQLSPDSIAA